MAYDHLGDFLSELEDEGGLVRIAAEVDWKLEIAEITDRVCKSPGGGPALFFQNVRGSSLPVVTNLLGSERRMCKALGAESFDRVAERIAEVLRPDVPESWLETLRLVPQFAQLTKLPPRLVKTAVCQQVVRMGRDVNLEDLPVPQCWPDEACATITLGQVHTRHPATGVRHVRLDPLEVCGPGALRVHWNVQQENMRIFEAYRQLNQQMPVAIALGGDPVYAFAAHAPLPPATDEWMFAGFLRGKNVDLVKCRSNDLEVPAQAELVIEGYIDTAEEWEPSGGIAAPTGFYTLPGPAPRMHVTAVTHRSNPVFPALVAGRPPTEEHWLSRAAARIFLPLVRLFIPELVDYHFPQSGVHRHLLFVSIRKEYPQQARKVMHALWGLGRMMVAKTIVVVDADVPVDDEQQVWFQVGASAHPGRDVVFCEGPADMLDHAAPISGLGHKMGIDATRKLAAEGHPRPWPGELRMSADVRERVTRRWHEYAANLPASTEER